MPRLPRFLRFVSGLGIVLALSAAASRAEDVPAKDLDELSAQNRALQQQVQQQQKQIDELRQRLDAMQSTGPHREPAVPPARPEPELPARAEAPAWRAAREIRVSGEAGLAFFNSGPSGAFPNAEFRLDDAKIFLEAPVWKNVYFFTGLELSTRESGDNSVHIGELYADIEDVFTSGHDQRLSLRIGRFNIPFGEEYLERNVMANPLITHSVTDLWGIDEGIQVYGTWGPVSYNLAVQNGGTDTRRDYNRDKAVTVRLGFDPLQSLHLSASAYRTGKLDAAEDYFSEIWFGGGLFGSLGSPATTQTFQASLFELDAAWQWPTGRLKATAGTARYSDDDTTQDNSRRFHYYSLEIKQQVTDKLYGAARYSEVRVPGGYPLVGLGDFGKYYFASPPTESLHRLSFGLGYRFGAPFVWKVEYSWENGRMINGAERNDENMFSTEIGLKF